MNRNDNKPIIVFFFFNSCFLYIGIYIFNIRVEPVIKHIKKYNN